MRGRIFISVLLGLSLVALPAFARHPREAHTRESPGRPDRPGHAIERSRPGDDHARDRASWTRGSVGKGTYGHVNNARGQKPIGNRTMGQRMACNEADECTMGKAGAQAIIFKVAHSRAPGKQPRH